MSYSGTGTAPARERIAEFVYKSPGNTVVLPEVAKEQVASAPVSNVPVNIPDLVDNSTGVSDEELSRLISEARAEGFREGEIHARTAFDASIAEQRRLVSDALASFQQERANYYSNVELQLVHLALAIAGKILHREAQVDRMVVAGLVKIMLERLQQSTTSTVRVRPEEAPAWKHFFSANPKVEIAGDASLEPGACRIETELGTAEMGLDAQLKEVENGFFDLLAQRPEARSEAK